MIIIRINIMISVVWLRTRNCCLILSTTCTTEFQSCPMLLSLNISVVYPSTSVLLITFIPAYQYCLFNSSQYISYFYYIYPIYQCCIFHSSRHISGVYCLYYSSQHISIVYSIQPSISVSSGPFILVHQFCLFHSSHWISFVYTHNPSILMLYSFIPTYQRCLYYSSQCISVVYSI